MRASGWRALRPAPPSSPSRPRPRLAPTPTLHTSSTRTTKRSFSHSSCLLTLKPHVLPEGSFLPDLHRKKYRVAVIGGGPAGFYSAYKILTSPGSQETLVDMLEYLPTPFGLSRYGVAPDHPEVKNCEHKFEEVARDPRFQYFGNVRVVGNTPPSSLPSSDPALHVSLDSLIPHYDSILLSYGASLDRPIGIPGEDVALSNVLSARSFVGWYNGHPDYVKSISPLVNLSNVEHVTIIGQGNVALDVARILLKPVDELKNTDMPEYALAELAKSNVKHVDIVGRRGPLQLAATTKEIRELVKLNGVGFVAEPRDQALVDDAVKRIHFKMHQSKLRKRAMDVTSKGLAANQDKSRSSFDRTWSFRFLLNPTKIIPSSSEETAVGAVEYEQNEIAPDHENTMNPGVWKAVGTGEKVVLPTDMLFKSVGYRSSGLPGVPFDYNKGVVINKDGRVVTEDDVLVPGLYAAGWVQSGPRGVIATTMFSSYVIADTLVFDLTLLRAPKLPPQAPRMTADFLSKDLALPGQGGQKRVVTWEDWEVIDAEETKRGIELGKPREKITDVTEMLNLLS